MEKHNFIGALLIINSSVKKDIENSSDKAGIIEKLKIFIKMVLGLCVIAFFAADFLVKKNQCFPMVPRMRNSVYVYSRHG